MYAGIWIGMGFAKTWDGDESCRHSIPLVGYVQRQLLLVVLVGIPEGEKACNVVMESGGCESSH